MWLKFALWRRTKVSDLSVLFAQLPGLNYIRKSQKRWGNKGLYFIAYKVYGQEVWGFL